MRVPARAIQCFGSSISDLNLRDPRCVASCNTYRFTGFAAINTETLPMFGRTAPPTLTFMRTPRRRALLQESIESALGTLKESSIVYPEPESEWARETLALRIIETVQQRGDRVRDDALVHLARARPPA